MYPTYCSAEMSTLSATSVPGFQVWRQWGKELKVSALHVTVRFSCPQKAEVLLTVADKNLGGKWWNGFSGKTSVRSHRD